MEFECELIKTDQMAGERPAYIVDQRRDASSRSELGNPRANRFVEAVQVNHDGRAIHL